MKKILPLLTLLLLVSMAFGQLRNEKPKKVVKAAFFDKTPPLRDMKVVLPGERDRSWKDNIIANESLKELDKANNSGPEINPPETQDYFGTREIRGPIRNFDGVGNVNGVWPPDTDGDVGPDHYFQMINLSFAIYSKEGELLYGPVDNSTLWNGFIGPWTGTNDGDPVVVYDELADRWMATQFAVNLSNGKSYELVAISETPDPTGSYYRYAFEFDYMNDYPKLSVWPDGYYSSYHMFSGTYRGAAFAVFERDKMLVGDSTARMVYFGEYPSVYGVLPSDFDGNPPPAGAPCYFIDMDDSHKMDFYELSVDWNNTANSTLNQTQSETPDNYSTGVNGIEQPNTSTKLDDLAGMLMYRLQYRNFGSYETMVTNHTVQYYGRAAIRWYELRKETGDWYIYQQGTYSPDPDNRWMGSIAMNGNGEIALGFSVSSDDIYPSIRYTGRSSDAPLGEMNYDELELKAGQSSQSGISRWGDYSCMSVDPADDSTFWFTTEYRKSNNWATWISSFDFSPPLDPVIVLVDMDTICEYTYYNASASATYQQSVLWETAGDGIFNNPTSLNTTYAHGPSDLSNGEVQLKITAVGYGSGQEIADSLMLYINEKPDADAGNDTLICTDDFLPLAASVINASGVLWETNRDGSFENDTLTSSIYYPGPNDIQEGSVEITLNAHPIAPCEEGDTDELTLTIDECTGIDRPGAQTVKLEIKPNPASDHFSYNISGLEQGKTIMSILNLNGQVLFRVMFNFTEDIRNREVDVSHFPEGTYIFRLEQENTRINKKLILR
ncbi:MAG: T9SS type A sorting domain-containing protein [Bacteroidota bacterium]|nr:T9SS type A sorting domain-containing protein [Bacteroidota bacterium]